MLKASQSLEINSHLLNLIERAKTLVEKAQIKEDQDRLNIQDILSAIRTQANLLDRRLLEAEMRQDIYAEMAEKILNRLDKNY